MTVCGYNWLGNYSLGTGNSKEVGGKKIKPFPPSVNAKKALAYLGSAVITRFGFPQGSFLEILDGAEQRPSAHAIHSLG